MIDLRFSRFRNHQVLLRLCPILFAAAQPLAAAAAETPFDLWEKDYALAAEYLESQDANKLLALIPSVDRVTRAYGAIKQSLPELQQEGKTLAKAVIDELNAGDEQSLALHPLISYLLVAYLENSDGADPYNKLAAEFLHVIGGNSCATKDFVDNQLIKKVHDQSSYTLYLRNIADYHSRRARRRSLALFVSQLPEVYRPVFKQDLALLLLDMPDLVESVDWLKDLGAGRSNEVKDTFSKDLETLLKKSQCAVAGAMVDARVAEVKLVLPAAMEMYDQVNRCMKKTGAAERVSFWESRRAMLAKSYGLLANVKIDQKIGNVYWVHNQFVEARTYIAKAIEQARQQQENAALADSLYQLVLVFENEGNDDGAIQTLGLIEQMTITDPQLMADALRMHGLLLIEGEKWLEAWQVFSRLVHEQEGLSPKEIDVSYHGLALFWRGYANFMRNERALAHADWIRLAKEWNTTYYGAVGHFLLEQTGGTLSDEALLKDREIFSEEWMHSGFLQSQVMILKRSQALLKLAQHDQAVCEMEELQAKELTGKQQAQLALLNYAAGRWFRAIQQFSELENATRVKLPLEYNRILFPKKYEREITDFSGRLGLDPFLVMSLMRQESIFNKFAESGVGAKGLMQLMDPTAILEVKKLRSGYLQKEEHQYVRERTGKQNWLFDPNVNIPIGIHHLHRLFGDSASVVFTLAGYNAGMNAVRRWQQMLPTKNQALFVERIPYKETRNYVKLILRNYFYYKKMYGTGKMEFPYFYAYFKNVLDKARIN